MALFLTRLSSLSKKPIDAQNVVCVRLSTVQYIRKAVLHFPIKRNKRSKDTYSLLHGIAR